jgi:ElaB/YqjD/DUF883 family membrane-anchored ribosome-binding protein
MTNESLQSSFPKTREDLSNLKQTAIDAACDLGSTASVHAQKAQGNLKDLASHAQSEGSDQFGQVRSSLNDLGDQVREYVAARPLAAIGTALFVGFLFGLSRRSRS